MTTTEQYLKVREEINTGSILLMRKDKPVSNIIRRHDREPDGSICDWSHVAIIFHADFNGRKALFVIDSNPGGVKPELLSKRIKECSAFIILKPQCNIDTSNRATYEVIRRAQKGIKYDYLNGFLEGLNRRYLRHIGLEFKIKENDEKDICSDLCRKPALEQEIVRAEFKLLSYPWPQDYVRFINKNVKILNS